MINQCTPCLFHTFLCLGMFDKLIGWHVDHLGYKVITTTARRLLNELQDSQTQHMMPGIKQWTHQPLDDPLIEANACLW